MDHKELYKTVYAMFDDLTPLKADCGVVCGKNCCKGDSGTGMLLFPFEETALSVTEKNGRRLAVCDGACDRSARPLSCRIFPFFPVVTDNGIEAVPDYRGASVCPLVTHFEEVIFDSDFIFAVKKAGELLFSCGEVADFMREITEDIDAEKKLYDMFLK